MPINISLDLNGRGFTYSMPDVPDNVPHDFDNYIRGFEMVMRAHFPDFMRGRTISSRLNGVPSMPYQNSVRRINIDDVYTRLGGPVPEQTLRTAAIIGDGINENPDETMPTANGVLNADDF